MAGKNQVTLTFAGDSEKLERAFQRTQDAAAASGKAYDKAADHAVQAAHRMETVAEASDHIDTLGSKATSSLGALSSGFELLGPSGSGAAQGLMTAALATDALSGAGEAATIATDTLKGAVNKAKTAYQGLSTAGKAAVLSLGAVGLAAAAAGAIFFAFKQHQEETKAQVDELSKALNFQTGALTRNNRETIAAKLEQRGLLEVAQKAGVSQNQLTDAILQGGDALDKLVPKQVNVNKNSTEQAVLMQRLSEGTHELSTEVGLAKDQQDRLSTATGAAANAAASQATAVRNATSALADQNKAIHDQLDPQLNLYHRTQDLKAAQEAYTEALKKHGPKSQEAKDALVDLAEKALAVKDATVGVSTAIDEKGAPAFQDLATQLGLPKEQARQLDALLKAMGIKLNNLNGKNFTFSVTQVNKVKGANSSSSRSPFDDEGNPTGRASGGSTNAGQVYMFGEAGREIGVFGSPGYVANARETMAILAGGKAGSGGGEVRVVLEARLDEGIILRTVDKGAKQGRLTNVAVK